MMSSLDEVLDTVLAEFSSLFQGLGCMRPSTPGLRIPAIAFAFEPAFGLDAAVESWAELSGLVLGLR
jgi:hypothetical protein